MPAQDVRAFPCFISVQKEGKSLNAVKFNIKVGGGSCMPLGQAGYLHARGLCMPLEQAGY